MADPFIGEIGCFGFNFAPQNWAQCNGQTVAISQNNALYAIIGTIYGGDGQSTFMLPNLQGEVPMHWGQAPFGVNTTIGEVMGSPNVTLTTPQMPQHTHSIMAVTVSGTDEKLAVPNAQAYMSGSRAPDRAWENPAANINSAFASAAMTNNGSSLPHDNMQPYLAVNFSIALFGVFPARN